MITGQETLATIARIENGWIVLVHQPYSGAFPFPNEEEPRGPHP